MEVVRIKKLLAHNLLIYIGLHCVRRSFWTVTTLATLLSINNVGTWEGGVVKYWSKLPTNSTKNLSTWRRGCQKSGKITNYLSFFEKFVNDRASIKKNCQVAAGNSKKLTVMDALLLGDFKDKVNYYSPKSEYSGIFFLSLCLFFSSCFNAVKGKLPKYYLNDLTCKQYTPTTFT